MTFLVWLGLAPAVLTMAVLGLRAYGAHRSALAMQALLKGLEASRTDRLGERTLPTTRYDIRELEGLPAPVQRYFRAVLKDGQPIITAVTIDLAGTFNMSATRPQWKPFTSRQRVVTRRPGFVWDAEIALLPALKVCVVDSYVGGEGLLHATVEGLLTMADVRGDGDIAGGEFMRWFAEAAWYPTALLPSQGVRWQAVDERSAKATLVDGPLASTLLFRFDDADLIDSFRAEARGGIVEGKLVMAPWEGRWSNYQWHDGVLLPTTGEVAWMRPEGRRPYFVGTIKSIALEFSS